VAGGKILFVPCGWATRFSLPKVSRKTKRGEKQIPRSSLGMPRREEGTPDGHRKVAAANAGKEPISRSPAPEARRGHDCDQDGALGDGRFAEKKASIVLDTHTR